jgi:hypothetical protein
VAGALRDPGDADRGDVPSGLPGDEPLGRVPAVFFEFDDGFGPHLRDEPFVDRGEELHVEVLPDALRIQSAWNTSGSGTHTGEWSGLVSMMSAM